jgi:hypothetical protein
MTSSRPPLTVVDDVVARIVVGTGSAGAAPPAAINKATKRYRTTQVYGYRAMVHFVERQIEEAMHRGEFDALEGAGRPIADLDGNYDPLWWSRSFVRRARAQDAAWELRRLLRRERANPELSPERVVELQKMITDVNEHLDPDERIEPL